MRGQFYNIYEAIPEIMNTAEIDRCVYDCFDFSGEKMIKSEHAIETAIGSILCNKRNLFMTKNVNDIEIFRKCSLMRIPLVGITFSDFQCKVASLCDYGWIIALPESLQEAVDMIIQAYYISENKKVLLPSIINIDDYSQSEIVQIPSHQSISSLLKKFKLTYNLESKEKQNLRTEFDDISEYIIQQQLAMKNAEKIINDLSISWYKKFRRSAGLYEEYRTEDADYILVTNGYNSIDAKSVVDELREKEEKVGLIRIRYLRPFPQLPLSEGKKIGVLDHAFLVGSDGAVSNELKNVVSFIATRRLGKKDFVDIFNTLKKSEAGERFWV